LPTIKDYADLNTTAGKCGLLQVACCMLWFGSYFMGFVYNLSKAALLQLQ